MKYDLATPEGMANAVIRQTQLIASLGPGGRWVVPRSGAIYEIDKERKIARVCLQMIPEPTIVRVFNAMGWTVMEADGVTLIQPSAGQLHVESLSGASMASGVA